VVDLGVNMFPLSDLRMKNIFDKDKLQPNSSYPIFNEFISKILPLLRSEQLADNNRARIESTRQNMFPLQQQRAPVREDNEIIDLNQFIPKPQSRNVVYGGMNPYQEGLLKLREQELGLSRERLANTTDINQQKVNIQRFKSENPNLKFVDNKAGKILALHPLSGEIIGEFDSGSLSEQDKLEIQQEGALNRIAASGRNRIEQIDRQGQIQRELQQLRGVQTIEAIERRAELEKELIGARGEETRKTNEAKPEPVGAVKSEAQAKYNKLINKHPEWREYVEIDSDTKLPRLTEKANKLSPEERRQIERELGLAEGKDIELSNETTGVKFENTKKKPDPLGIRK